MRNRHLGSDFDEFLEQEGLLADAEATAAKRVIAFRIEQEMRRNRLTKATLAKRMGTSRSALDRLLDPNHSSVTLRTLETAARALGKRLKVDLA